MRTRQLLIPLMLLLSTSICFGKGVGLGGASKSNVANTNRLITSGECDQTEIRSKGKLLESLEATQSNDACTASVTCVHGQKRSSILVCCKKDSSDSCENTSVSDCVQAGLPSNPHSCLSSLKQGYSKGQILATIRELEKQSEGKPKRPKPFRADSAQPVLQGW